MGNRTRTIVRLGGVAAFVGGLLWVVKFAVIAVQDDFEPVESVVFVAGLLGTILGGVAVAALAARRESALPPIAVFVLLLLAVGVGTFLLQVGVQAAVNAAVDIDNVGISEEVGTLFVGVLWLAVGLALVSRSHAPQAL